MMTAKLFENGRSQAVRLPKECRFDGDNGCCAGHFHLFKWHFDLQYLSDEWSKSAK